MNLNAIRMLLDRIEKRSRSLMDAVCKNDIDQVYRDLDAMEAFVNEIKSHIPPEGSSHEQ